MLLVGLRGAAQRAEILQYPFGVVALVGAWRGVSLSLVVADESAVERHRGDDDVPDRPAVAQLAANPLGLPPKRVSRSRTAGERTPSTGRRAALAAIRSPPCPSRASVITRLAVAGADAAFGGSDRAAKRLRVGRVGEQCQVRERVADLGALIQSEAAEHAVRDPGLRQRGLHRPHRVAGSRQTSTSPGGHAAGSAWPIAAATDCAPWRSEA